MNLHLSAKIFFENYVDYKKHFGHIFKFWLTSLGIVLEKTFWTHFRILFDRSRYSIEKRQKTFWTHFFLIFFDRSSNIAEKWQKTFWTHFRILVDKSRYSTEKRQKHFGRIFFEFSWTGLGILLKNDKKHFGRIFEF